MSEPVLTRTGVSKHFGDISAADDINIDVAQTEFFALLGPSASGKTTMLRMIAGLSSRPSLLLLDEPLANLDLELCQEMEIESHRFQLELGIPFVYVTHNHEEAPTMSDRMAIMRDGKTEQVGAKLSLYHDPTSAFVAPFLGSPNALNGEVIAVEDDHVTLDWIGHRIHARPKDEGDMHVTGKAKDANAFPATGG